MTASYMPDVDTQRKIIEQDLRLCHNTLAQLGFQRKVEERIAPLVGETSAERLAAIDRELRIMAARIEAYEELLAELPAELPPASTNGAKA